MALTSTVNFPNNVLRLANGTFLEDATAVALKIVIGFRPKFVLVRNETSSDEYMWFEGMADAEACKRVAAGTGSIITTLGITPAADGFTIGLDTDVNVVNEQISWIALG